MTGPTTTRWLIIAGALFLVAVIALVTKPWNKLPAGGDESGIHPILLVHGLGGCGDDWKDQGYHDTFNAARHFAYRGNLSFEGGALKSPEKNPLTDHLYPYYSVSLTNGAEGPIENSAAELAKAIAYVREDTGAKTVIVIGFSIGGIVTREYLTSPAYQQDVKHLITINSPHMGSDLARIPHWAHSTVEKLEAEGSTVRLRTLDLLLDQAGKALGWNLRSAGARSLLPPDHPDGTYLRNLNSRKHPDEISYDCIISDIDVTQSIKQTLASLGEPGDEKSLDWKATQQVLAEVARVSIRAATDGHPADQELQGDGVVSSESQNLNTIAAFRENDELIAALYTFKSSHTDHSISSVVLTAILQRHSRDLRE